MGEGQWLERVEINWQGKLASRMLELSVMRSELGINWRGGAHVTTVLPMKSSPLEAPGRWKVRSRQFRKLLGLFGGNVWSTYIPMYVYADVSPLFQVGNYLGFSHNSYPQNPACMFAARMPSQLETSPQDLWLSIHIASCAIAA